MEKERERNKKTRNRKGRRERHRDGMLIAALRRTPSTAEQGKALLQEGYSQINEHIVKVLGTREGTVPKG